MTLSDLSIRRPVLAAVANLLIVVFGIAALFELPIRELPDIDTSVVSISTKYTGAAPKVVDTDITEIIEGAVSGIAGVKTISSESRRGQSRTPHRHQEREAQPERHRHRECRKRRAHQER